MALPAILLSLLAGAGLLVVLARKWVLPPTEVAALIMLSTAGGAAITLVMVRAWPGTYWVSQPVALLVSQLSLFAGGLLVRFYRDPDRRPPDNPHAVVSPADGTVIYMRTLPPGTVLRAEKSGTVTGLDELQQTDLARRELWQIGISMVFSDVHVNRAPIEGQVTLVYRRPGAFLSLRRQEAASRNEHQTIVIEGGNAQVALVQVASRLVRRIQGFVRQGDQVEKGQRIGIIKFGSQVDLFIPTAMVESMSVALGEHLAAGETVVCQLREYTSALALG